MNLFFWNIFILFMRMVLLVVVSLSFCGIMSCCDLIVVLCCWFLKLYFLFDVCWLIINKLLFSLVMMKFKLNWFRIFICLNMFLLIFFFSFDFVLELFFGVILVLNKWVLIVFVFFCCGFLMLVIRLFILKLIVFFFWFLNELEVICFVFEVFGCLGVISNDFMVLFLLFIFL